MNNHILPTLFVSHGSPLLAMDETQGAEYRAWGASLQKPQAILVFSAHWESDQLSFGETITHNELLYDYWGFPEELYDIQYAAPGAAEFIEPIAHLLGDKYQLATTSRGLDHGIYIPFLHMWPKADIPILQMSMPLNFSNHELFELGATLSPLQQQGVLIIGSGSLTHNLREFNPQYRGEPISWAVEFDEWIKTTLLNKDIDALLNWEVVAPQAKRNHPTPEHFRPLIIATGAGNQDAVSFPLDGFQYGTFTRRSVQFG